MPVGLSYDAKATFRSGVLLVFGEPISVERPTGRLPARRTPGRRAAHRGHPAGRWTRSCCRPRPATCWRVWPGWRTGPASIPDREDDPAAATSARSALLAGYRAMRERDPERAQRIVRAARDYARVLAHLGVRDPWALEAPRVRSGPGPAGAGQAGADRAAGPAGRWRSGGCPIGWPGKVAPRITRGEDDLLGTVKILAGALFIGLFWIGEMVAAGCAWGWRGALAVAVLAPPGGYAAMRLQELAGDTAEAFRQRWLRRARRSQVDRLVARRRALADEISPRAGGGQLTRSIRPAAPMPPPTHMVMTA